MKDRFRTGGFVSWALTATVLSILPQTTFAQGGTFVPTGSMASVRTGHTATLLQTGKVLIAGGCAGPCNFMLSTAEFYDPVTGSFTPTGSMTFGGEGLSAALLPNGRVLMLEGTVAELYSPASGLFSRTGNPAQALVRPTAIVLPTGKVVIFGGTGTSIFEMTAEFYDPASGTFSLSGTTTDDRLHGTATLLPNGKVLLTGGVRHLSARGDAQIFDPATATFTTTGSMSGPRYAHTATLLPNGKVLIVGGFTCFFAPCQPAPTTVANAELYDPATGTFSPSGMTFENHTNATLLPAGTVLMTGSFFSAQLAEAYDLSTGSFRGVGAMNVIRAGHTVTVLLDGRVLIAGGNNSSSGSLSSAEIYDPTPQHIGNGGPFTFLGDMTTFHVSHTATRLPSGKVLLAGGIRFLGATGAMAASELYNPSTNNFTATGSLNTPRGGHTATLLPNGKVLVAGGRISCSISPCTGTATANLYDSLAGIYTPTSSMTMARWSHTATLLPNGKVLIAGGIDNFGEGITSTELYDPLSGTFTLSGSMITSHAAHTATLLPTGKVLIVGGLRRCTNSDCSTTTATAELYDPSVGAFSSTPSMTVPRSAYTATLLANGKVLLAGGTTGNAFLSSAELYDPSTETFVPTGAMSEVHSNHAATLLPDGNILILGGFFGIFPGPAPTELYDPLNGTFRPAGNMNVPRYSATATLLTNGKVLVAGGFGDWISPSTAELYSPANRLPIANAGLDQTMECASKSGVLVTLDGSVSSDPEGDALTYLWKNSGGEVIGTTAIVNGVMVRLGTSMFTLTVTDSHGDSDSDSMNMTVRDTTPPTLSVMLSPNSLWPADHKLVPVTSSVQVNDVCDANPHVVLLSLISNELDDGQGDGDTPNDIQGAILNTDDRSFLLRAERSAKGAGRTYTAAYRATDASGNARTASATATVPLNQKPPK